ncbi:porin [Candidatus Pelagibacter communis]|uniref:porin n=1 Tax=Pelagibacter ubique TaxID=198252 RepID=UPI000AC3D6D4|nr:porin [Candidatus Pelagibacter ubique]
MNNLKKLGLTALGTALVSSSAFAGALDVTGTAGLTYVGNSTQDNGDSKLSQKTTISFTGSADLDNGFTVSYYNNVSGAAMTAGNSHFDVDMGDMGKLRFAGAGASGNGAVGAWDDVMPAANEESWHQGTDGIDQQRREDSFIYTNSTAVDGVTVILNYKPGEVTHDSTVGAGIKFTGVEGLDVGVATEDNNTTDGAVVENTVAYIKYAMDAFTVGFQANETDSQTASADTEFEAWGVSYAVSEDISISYGSSTVEFEDTSLSDQEADAIGVSWTNGSMSVTASRHDIANVAGASTDDRDVTEVNLTFAF